MTGLESLNRRVYDEIFLTPRDDPWMGLVSAASCTAIDGAGLTQLR